MSQYPILVPSMGESVTEATVARWLKKQGEAVGLDEPLVELETDKVTLEVAAPQAGVLEIIDVPQGQTVSIGAQLGLINGTGVAVAPVAAPVAPPVAPSPSASPKTSSETVVTSPAARKISADNGLDPSQIPASGKGGRVTKEDVLRFLESPSPIITTAMSSVQNGDRRVPMTRLRKTIADRLKNAQNTAAILTTFNEVDMSRVMALRDTMKDRFEKKHGVKLGFMSFFLKATLAALKEIPSVNAQIDGDDIVYKDGFHIGVAVGAPQGLVVPVVKNADQLSFAELERTISAFGAKAKEGKLTMEEMMGGTFTVSNGGVYGSLLSTPILNPPQSGILGMHKIEKRPVVVGDSIVIRPMMYLALSYDHRIIDGKEAVTFLVRIKECMEEPERLLLEV